SSRSANPSGSPSPPALEPSSIASRQLDPGVGPVQTSQMSEKSAQSEMRIGLSTSAFGSVEVRTTVRANEVGVTIGSERGDLRSILSNDLQAIGNNLMKQDLRLNAVVFQGSSTVSYGSSSEGNGRQQSFPHAPSQLKDHRTEENSPR